MYRLLAFSIVLYGCIFNLQGQTYFLPQDTAYSYLDDTLHIQEVEIISPVSQKPEVGRKVDTYTPIQRENTITGSLTNLISKYSPVYIKSDAGGLATFRIRGTSSAHTSVLIGGIDINSLTLGSSNASNIPVYLFDDISLAYGGSSASVGSGSIGGTVRLGLKNNWTNGLNSEVLSSAGSFGEYTYGAKVFLGNGKYEVVTRVLNFKTENNFPFLNTESFDVEKHKYHRDTQKYSAIINRHVLQQFNFKFNDSQIINSFFWYSDNYHEAQPSMQVNIDNSLTSRPIVDRNFRSWITYSNTSNSINFKIEGGFIKDKNIDNNDQINTIGTKRIISNIDLNYKADNFNIQFDTKYKYIIPEVYAYDQDISEQHLDIHGALFYTLFKGFSTTVNLRQQFVTNYKAPFTPSIGWQYILLSKNEHLLKLTGNIQKSYRIPTFNDRYWGQTGYEGNEDLNPENANNIESGIYYMICNNNFSLVSNVNTYYMDVDNWIMWIQNNSKWAADNISRVIAKGIEFHTHVDMNFNKIKLKTGVNFSVNSTIEKESEINQSGPSRKDKQIIYMPKFIGNTFISTYYKGFQFTIDGSYTGSRYYEDSDDKLKSYTLINSSISKKIKFEKNNLDLSFQTNNIFNTQYQNQFSYAMPEINFRFTVKYNFKLINK